MKKRNIINLIKYYAEHNDDGFRSEVYEIAKYFDSVGDYQLAEYVTGVISNTNTFVPQINENNFSFFKRLELGTESLPLPDSITEDIKGILNAIGHNVGVNKFLFEGAPGTGKTETVKQIARILERELFIVQFDALVDSKMGQTAKNIGTLFDEISSISQPHKVVILFDEIDAIAIDRINSNDIREMGRATTAVLKGLDNLNDQIMLIATTNLYNAFDKALTRRFDTVINFNRYTREDLLEISETMLDSLLSKFKSVGRNVRLFRKIMNNLQDIPYPGELKNMLKTSLAFSDPNNEYDYLKRLFKTITGITPESNLKLLNEMGLTVREIETLTSISKSQVSRELKELDNE